MFFGFSLIRVQWWDLWRLIVQMSVGIASALMNLPEIMEFDNACGS